MSDRFAFSRSADADVSGPVVLFSEEEREKLRRSELAKYDAAYFAGDYWKEDLQGVTGNRGLSYDDPDHESRFGILAQALSERVAPVSVLDVGCGPGLLCKAIAERCEQVAGVDASTAAIELAERNLRSLNQKITVHHANVISLPFDAGAFELVVCLDVLEHLPVFDIQAAVTEIIRVAGSRIVFSINTDNPYEFHPTILSPATWRGIFASQQGIVRDAELEAALSVSISSCRPEYDFFCYRRMSPKGGPTPAVGDFAELV